jgi:hypothetical protein
MPAWRSAYEHDADARREHEQPEHAGNSGATA